DGVFPRLGRDLARDPGLGRPRPGPGALPEGAQREDLLRVPRDRDLHGATGNPRLLLSAGPPRGLWDRRLGTPVRLVGARNPVLDRLGSLALAAGRAGKVSEPGRGREPVTHSTEA